MKNELRFASTEQALQHLADVVGKKIRVAKGGDLVIKTQVKAGDLGGMFKELYKTHADEILKWFQGVFSDIDFKTYEGGIESWFGLGSVMLFELGVKVSLKFEEDSVTFIFA